MIIGIDWNSTIQNQKLEVIKQTQIKYGVPLTESDFSVWDAPLGHKVGVSDKEFTRWAWTSEEIQQAAYPYPNAKAVIELLYQQHTIKIITSTVCSVKTVKNWFLRHRIRYHDLIVTKDKNAVKWDILIDDNPITLKDLHPDRHVIRYEQGWNRHLKDMPVIRGWNISLMGELQKV